MPTFSPSHLPPRWTLPPAAPFAQEGEKGLSPVPPCAPPPQFIPLPSSEEQVALYAWSPSCRKGGRQGCHLPCQPRPPLLPPGGTTDFPRRHQRCVRAPRRGASARARDPPPPWGHRRGPSSRRFARSRFPWRPPRWSHAPGRGYWSPGHSFPHRVSLPATPLPPTAWRTPPYAPPMTHRVQALRPGALQARAMPFVSPRWGSGAVMSSASDPVDLARLMVAWTALDRDAGLISTFADSGAASS